MAIEDKMREMLLEENSSNPVEILEKMMSIDGCHMHGPEHHFMIGAVLLTAYRNAGGDIDLKKALAEMKNRSRGVPGGTCGLWGTCGAGISAGMYMSIITGAQPHKREGWGISNKMTALVLTGLSECGGPRCCKRGAYMAVTEAVKLTKQVKGITMEITKPLCTRQTQNDECIGRNCPFFYKDGSDV